MKNNSKDLAQTRKQDASAKTSDEYTYKKKKKASTSKKTKNEKKKESDSITSGSTGGVILFFVIVTFILYRGGDNSDNNYEPLEPKKNEQTSLLFDSVKTKASLKTFMDNYTPIFGDDWKEYLDSTSKQNRLGDRKKYTDYHISKEYRKKVYSLDMVNDEWKKLISKYLGSGEAFDITRLDFYERSTVVNVTLSVLWEDGIRILGVESGAVTGINFPVYFPRYKEDQFSVVTGGAFSNNCANLGGIMWGYQHKGSTYSLETPHRFDYSDINTSATPSDSTFIPFWCKNTFTVEVPYESTSITFLGVSRADNNITFSFLDEIYGLVNYWNEDEPYMTDEEKARKPTVVKHFQKSML